MREQAIRVNGMNVINNSDVKIGEKILDYKKWKKTVFQCYDHSSGRRTYKPIVTRLVLKDCILPYITFERPEFQRVLDYVKDQVITETKGVFSGLIAVIDGIEYKFGTGGLHASVNSSVISSSDTHQLIDVDVASYYPGTLLLMVFTLRTLVLSFVKFRRSLPHPPRTLPQRVHLKTTHTSWR